ncbi:ParM/StbA family protein [Bacillus paranthracis]|uniref:ParM/StbA family protein n=1 Tax=Bacillus paranthracis TaxID=2026186 RepID=UPI001879F1D6|nr:ParM/StbA family protein [Bacillus paranthracis]MBE7117287.1 ParM/StbA family protein [Bacillus paranthracis]MBE7134901.1 ParM/StbA family protein [Bacillus paranthracis]MBE7156310.1 ParM/StbA family protein [Bacillus paranthracis]
MTDKLEVVNEYNKVIAWESANSFVKVCSEGKTKTYANTMTKAPVKKFQGDLFDVETKDTDVVYEFGIDRFNVGKTKGYDSSTSSNEQRYKTMQFYRESIIAISQFAKNGDTIHAVTALPSIHNKEDIIEELSNRFVGEHHITIKKGKRTEKRKFRISKLTVILQPEGTFYFFIADENGNVREQFLNRVQQSKTLVFDIGWGTSDTAVFDGLDMLSFDEIKGVSMKKIFEEIKQYVLQDNELTANVDLLDIEKQLRESGNKAVTIANVTYDVKDIVEDIYKKYAEKFITNLTAMYDLNDYGTVLLTGGGFQLLENYIKPHLSKNGDWLENVYPLTNGQVSNVKGYYIYGKYIAA